MGIDIDIDYVGNLKTRAVHRPSGTAILTAAPLDNQGDGSTFSPTDLAATSIGTCVITIMAIAARGLGVKLDGAKVHVTKEMSAALPRRIARLPVTVTLPAGVPAEHRAKLEEAARGCPVTRSLAPEVDVALTFVWE